MSETQAELKKEPNNMSQHNVYVCLVLEGTETTKWPGQSKDDQENNAFPIGLEVPAKTPVGEFKQMLKASDDAQDTLSHAKPMHIKVYHKDDVSKELPARATFGAGVLKDDKDNGIELYVVYPPAPPPDRFFHHHNHHPAALPSGSSPSINSTLPTSGSIHSASNLYSTSVCVTPTRQLISRTMTAFEMLERDGFGGRPSLSSVERHHLSRADPNESAEDVLARQFLNVKLQQPKYHAPPLPTTVVSRGLTALLCRSDTCDAVVQALRMNAEKLQMNIDASQQFLKAVGGAKGV